MIKITFNNDYQLNDCEDYVEAGQQVELYPYPIYKKGFIPVKVTDAFSYEGNPIKVNDVEWFASSCFKEYSEEDYLNEMDRYFYEKSPSLELYEKNFKVFLTNHR